MVMRSTRLLVALALVAAPLVAASADGAGAASTTRLAGADRYATAAAVAHASFSPGVPVVYVVTGRSFPDALTAGPAAAERGGPVLLVDDGIPSSTASELHRLAPASIVVVGGQGAVSDSVVDQL